MSTVLSYRQVLDLSQRMDMPDIADASFPSMIGGLMGKPKRVG